MPTVDRRTGTMPTLTSFVLALTLVVGFVSTGAAEARVPSVPAVSTSMATTSVGSAAGGWSEGACADSSGVTVAVDFQQLGGGTALRCAPGPVADGFDALGRAGISFQTATRFPGFLCRIAGLPASDPCITAAPATAYWSYWLAARGGPWCYSNLGAGNRRPPPGTVEGWSFSLTTDGATAPPPRVAVPAAIPGVAPVTLGGGDCDSTPPAAVPVTPEAAGPTGRIPDPDPDASPSDPASGPNEIGGVVAPDSTIAPGAIPVDATPSTIAPSTTAAVGSPDSARDTPSGSAVGRRADDNGRDSEEIGSVDLGDDGTTGPASPLGVVLALTLIGALGAGALLVRRRAAHD